MSRTHILLIFLLLPLTLRSQEDICIGKELVLYSTRFSGFFSATELAVCVK